MSTILEPQKQEQELITPELEKKFEGRENVEFFMSEGLSIEDLKNSEIIHPTEADPIVILDKKPVGMWL